MIHNLGFYCHLEDELEDYRNKTILVSRNVVALAPSGAKCLYSEPRFGGMLPKSIQAGFSCGLLFHTVNQSKDTPGKTHTQIFIV